jgi:hypothetical protein
VASIVLKLYYVQHCVLIWCFLFPMHAIHSWNYPLTSSSDIPTQSIHKWTWLSRAVESSNEFVLTDRVDYNARSSIHMRDRLHNVIVFQHVMLIPSCALVGVLDHSSVPVLIVLLCTSQFSRHPLRISNHRVDVQHVMLHDNLYAHMLLHASCCIVSVLFRCMIHVDLTRRVDIAICMR